MALQRDIALTLNQQRIGKEMEVLIDKKEDDFYIGRSQFDAYDVDGVVYVKRPNLKIGNIYKVKVIDAYEYDLVAK